MNTFFNNDGTAPPQRSRIIERTMGLFATSVAMHTALSFFFYAVAPASWVVGSSPYVLLGVFLGILTVSGVVGFLAHQTRASKALQLVTLGAYLVVEAVLFVPLLQVGVAQVGLDTILRVSLLSSAVFAGIACYVFYTKADFSSWDRYIFASLFGSVGITVVSIITGFHSSILFSGLMLVLGSIWVLYDLSNVTHRYQEDEYVAATLDLFSSFAFTLWHAIRLVAR